MEEQERPGVVANGRFYQFTSHLLDNTAKGLRLEATDERIITALSEPDHVQLPEGNRTVYWKSILESDQDNWWLVVVMADEASGLQILTAYRDMTGRGERLWGM